MASLLTIAQIVFFLAFGLSYWWQFKHFGLIIAIAAVVIGLGLLFNVKW